MQQKLFFYNLHGPGRTYIAHISPVGGPGAPKIFLVVGPEEAYFSSEHGVPPVTERGRGIFQPNFGKKLGQKRGDVCSEQCLSDQFFSCSDI